MDLAAETIARVPAEGVHQFSFGGIVRIRCGQFVLDFCI
jgi:hypothetical protein